MRNIRAYQTAGLLPPPRLQGRLALYGKDHLGRLQLIRDWRTQGFGLEAIKSMLEQTPNGAWPEYALISELFSKTFFTVETPQLKRIQDMAVHWQTQATATQRERLHRNGLYRPASEDHVEVLSPALERIGIQLAELRVPLETVLDLQDVLIGHLRSIGQAYVQQLFLAWVQALRQGNRGLDSAQLQQLFEKLRPLAIGSISAAFPVILQQEFDRAVAENQNTPPETRKG